MSLTLIVGLISRSALAGCLFSVSAFRGEEMGFQDAFLL